MMNEDRSEVQKAGVLGQKYAYATASLILGIASFISLLGLEKGVLAIVFAWLALKAQPQPPLTERRALAKAGMVLGIIMVAMVPIFLALYAGRFQELIGALRRLQ